ncbi:MAG: hypothetical protein L0Z55_08110 [Planctomycetes bacterium]|nr:hypothetical protein [Planctomycetota bacterium]
MSNRVNLACRCGWKSTFAESQIGLTLSCPECARSFYVTADAAEFANRNVGEQDFRFDDGDLARDRGGSGAAPGAAGGVRGAGVRARSRTVRAPNQGFVATDRKRMAPPKHGDRNRRATWIALAAVLVAAIAGYIWYRVGLRNSQEAQARATADQAIEILKRRARVDAESVFENAAVMEVLMQAFEGWSAGGERLEHRRRRERFAYPDYHADYRVQVAKLEYEVKLDLRSGPRGWQVTNGAAGEVPPAFRTLEQD